jgi:catechol 2,3-dioxygenase-like lactoylglutathione lyase family enzyme
MESLFPRLTHICLFADDLEKLVSWYATLLDAEPTITDGIYAEIATTTPILAFFSSAAHNQLAPETAHPGLNANAILEFEVRDVDAEYRSVVRSRQDIVKPPTTQSWGNRSCYLRDPQGNLISLYTRLTPAT